MDLLQPTPHERTAEVETPDGARLRYRVWEGDGEPRAELVVLSGVMSNTAWFRPLAEQWVEQGYRVIGAERRGSGLNEAGRGDTESAQMLLDDATAVIEHGATPGRPLILVGWCWGAILSVHLALLLGTKLAGLALLTPGLFPSAELSTRMKALAGQGDEGAPENPVLHSPIEDEMFTDGPALDGFIRRDSARWQRFSPRFLAVSTKLSFAARMRLRKLTVPVLTVLARDDVTTDNDKMLAELARLPDERVRSVTLPGGHGLQFDAAPALARHLDEWAKDALGV